jgi:hypothetical protein
MTAEEVTYGTVVTPDRGFELRNESLKLESERIESPALRSGTRVQRSDRWATGKRAVSGDITMDLINKSQGRWWKHAFGGVATSQPDGVGSPTVYLHTFTPGDLPVGQTIQVGRPNVNGTTQAFTYHGCKVASWELACAVGEIASLKVSILGEDEDTTTSLASISYPTGIAMMTFVHGSVTVGGSPANIKSVTASGNNGLNGDRYFLGGALRKNPLENALREYTGSFEAEFEDLTAYNRFVNGTEAEVVLLFQGAIINGSYRYETKITANVRFDGETPNVGGPDIVPLNTPWKVVDNGTTSIKVEYQTTDSTP